MSSVRVHMNYPALSIAVFSLGPFSIVAPHAFHSPISLMWEPKWLMWSQTPPKPRPPARPSFYPGENPAKCTYMYSNYNIIVICDVCRIRGSGLYTHELRTWTGLLKRLLNQLLHPRRELKLMILLSIPIQLFLKVLMMKNPPRETWSYSREKA